MLNFLIMAGGAGTRLWPKSRQTKPKFLHQLTTAKTMLEETVDRIKPLIKKDNLYIVTIKDYFNDIQKLIPQCKNIIVEPAIRNTAPAIGLGTLFISQKNPLNLVMALPADAHIEKPAAFRLIIHQAERFLEKHPDRIVTIGIKPTEPLTGYGYIEGGKLLEKRNQVFQVDRFIEKPELKSAKQFLKKGNYYWNSGIFIFQSKQMLKYFELHSKEIYQRLMLIKKGWGSKKLEKIINQQYQQMPKISIDYALIEKIAQKIVVIPAAIGWSDVGSWSSLYDILKNKLGENIAVGCEHLHLDSKEILIHGNKKLIATIGVENMVIIDSGDVILICHKERTQDIKKLVDHLQSEKRKEYL